MKFLHNLSALFIAMVVFASCSNNNDEVDATPEFATIDITNVEDGQIFTIGEEAVIETTLYIPEGTIEAPQLVFTYAETNETVTVDLIGQIPEIAGEQTVNLSATITPSAAGMYELQAQFYHSSDAEGAQNIITSEEFNVASGAFLPAE
ncbi:hypothetical protein MY04_0300 [Flammeovirga sp. MY04]|uniref:hypothetical protein n=1 Tax=Flammeovirga sp. MY04 TaxID=1191459 RepID=UPI0008061DC2|nr:hypothetical protein [Flammeovirga sp. MY04]ANQ47682.1 hypothetical protein MY04_0300 [Flammeovirga sp. MY04]